MREQENFRDMLLIEAKRLDEMFPNKDVLSWGDVAKFTGESLSTVTKKYAGVKNQFGDIIKVRLAKELIKA